MKKKNLFPLKTLLLIFFSFGLSTLSPVFSNEPKSVYLFAYTSEKRMGQNGLHFAWSTDGENWHTIGPEYSYIRCDYGQWGAEKRMNSPFLFRGVDDTWHLIWSLNEQDNAFAHAASKDLIYWGRQSYPLMNAGKNCLNPLISFDKAINQYTITWQSIDGNKTSIYNCSTKDFKTFSDAQTADNKTYKDDRIIIIINGKTEKGTKHKVSWSLVDNLIKSQEASKYRNSIWSEVTATDHVRFASLQPIEASITADISKSKKISNLLIGAFFEDINYAADGGLYAELIQNRDFEYSLADKNGRDQSWNSSKAWSLNNENATLKIDSTSPIHPNNKHYAVLNISKVGAGLVNEGFDGIPVKAGEKYNFSIFAQTLEGKSGKITIRLTDNEGKIHAEASTKTISKDWTKYETVLTAKETITDARLEVIPQTEGTVALDMISLFPQNTFNKRKNGLRTDLAQIIADMKPRFVRFPGGCLAHGDGIENIYHWKNTVGSLETRVPQRNIWGYHQTAGLGYFEYFQFCEDMGAEPIPIVAAGVPCQNSARHGCPLGGQQGGIPIDEMDQYIQDVLDLVEWANGDAKKTKWGKVRAEAGHPKPFDLKYIGVGNEDLITDIFEERFTMIYNALKEKHPEITVIGTAGPFCEGTDYVEGWKIASKLEVPIMDEHYYQTPGWFIHNQDFYDKYDRSKSKVYLGEYAAHLPGRPNNIETALAEALYLTSLERNGDIVSMTSYAPLLAKEGHTQWNPDLIYFNNTEVKPTVGYYVQKLYGQNSGDEYLPNSVLSSDEQDAIKKRIGISFVKDNSTNNLIIKLVNMLPVAVNSTIDLKDFNIANTQATKSLLTGNPDDKQVKPIQSTVSISDKFIEQLPPYSFTVIRIQLK